MFARTTAILLALFAFGTSRAAADGIEFETLSAAATGIRPIFDAWYADEMQRQGGPGQSHGWWPWGLRAFDYDRDGDLDLLASHHGIPRSIVLKSLFKETGEHRFINATAELGLDHRDLPGADDRPWIWDFDGDGWLDICGVSDESKPPGAWNQEGKKLISTGKPLLPGLAHPREVIDLNGDGFLDVDGGSKGQWFYIPEERSFRHEKTLRFPVPEGIPATVIEEVQQQSQAANNRFFRLEYLTHDVVGYDTLGYAPQPIDLNGDGRNDVVIHGSGGYGAVYLGRYLLRTESGELVDRTKELGLPIDAAPIMIQDLTGDGRIDLLLVEKGTGGLYVQTESGKFERRENALSRFLTIRGPYLIRAWRTDLDNDGDADLVLSNPRLGSEAVFENRGGGDFVEVLKATGWDSNPIAIADFDGDGRMDLAIGGGPGDDRKFGVTLYLNRTKNTGHFLKIAPRAGAPNPYAVGAFVEVFAAGDAEKADSKPLFVEKAHPEGTSIHAGLGKLTKCDVRLTMPGAPSVTVHNVEANREVEVRIGTGASDTRRGEK